MNSHVPEFHDFEPEPSYRHQALAMFRKEMIRIRARLDAEATSREFLTAVVHTFVGNGRRPFAQAELDALTDAELAEYAEYAVQWFERMADEEFGHG